MNKLKLKKLFTILFLFLFLLQCSFKSAVVAWFYANQDVISKTLCENKNNPKMHCKGKCYLNKQLKKEEKNARDIASILKIVEEIIVFNQVSADKWLSTNSSIIYIDSYFITPYSALLNKVFHPPATV